MGEGKGSGYQVIKLQIPKPVVLLNAGRKRIEPVYGELTELSKCKSQTIGVIYSNGKHVLRPSYKF